MKKKCHFGAFHIFAYFSSKWAKIYISSVLWSTGGDFHHFKRLSKKLKKKWSFIWPFQKVENNEVFHDRRPAKNCHFWEFHIFAIFYPNEQILIFQVSCGKVVVVSILLKALKKVEKVEVFHDRWPAKKCHFWAFHIFAYFTPKWANIYIWSALWWWRFSSS